jgi:hypothetical protein
MITHESFVLNPPKGVIDGCLEPIGPGTSPFIAYLAMAFSRTATCPSSIATSTI